LPHEGLANGEGGRGHELVPPVSNNCQGSFDVGFCGALECKRDMRCPSQPQKLVQDLLAIEEPAGLSSRCSQLRVVIAGLL